LQGHGDFLWVALIEEPMLRTSHAPIQSARARSVTKLVHAVRDTQPRFREFFRAKPPNRLRHPRGGVTMCFEDKGNEMARMVSHAVAALCIALAGPAWGAPPAADDEEIATSADNLMLVLRESPGENKQDEGLEPYGPIEGTLPDGRRVQFDASWYRYLGDMHIRLVFEGSRSLQSASADDLRRLHLTTGQALDRALGNLLREHGTPSVQPWTGGMMQVRSAAPDFTSSYFLDREFWHRLQAPYPDGLVVAVPRRGEVVYAAAGDDDAVANLRFGAAALYAGGPGARLSSALYLFKDDHWSVFQPPEARSD
jgi:hypothetical protein